MPLLHESQIISELKQEGDGALARYFAVFRASLTSYINTRINNGLAARLDSSDIVQDAYLRAQKKLGAYVDDPRMAFYPWLKVMCHQTVVECLQKHVSTKSRSVKQESSLNCDAIVLNSAEKTPSRIVSKKETWQHTQRLISMLPPIDANIIVLRHFEGWSLHKISESLKISYDATRKRYQRALVRLSQLARTVHEG